MFMFYTINIYIVKRVTYFYIYSRYHEMTMMVKPPSSTFDLTTFQDLA
jgi:hypothetical protein